MWGMWIAGYQGHKQIKRTLLLHWERKRSCHVKQGTSTAAVRGCFAVNRLKVHGTPIYGHLRRPETQTIIKTACESYFSCGLPIHPLNRRSQEHVFSADVSMREWDFLFGKMPIVFISSQLWLCFWLALMANQRTSHSGCWNFTKASLWFHCPSTNNQARNNDYLQWFHLHSSHQTIISLSIHRSLMIISRSEIGWYTWMCSWGYGYKPYRPYKVVP